MQYKADKRIVAVAGAVVGICALVFLYNFFSEPSFVNATPFQRKEHAAWVVVILLALFGVLSYLGLFAVHLVKLVRAGSERERTRWICLPLGALLGLVYSLLFNHLDGWLGNMVNGIVAGFLMQRLVDWKKGQEGE